MLLLAVLYPAWGLVQQVLVQGMVVRNLEGALSPPAIAVAAGLLFGAVHLPHVALAAATALLGAVFTLIFLRSRNVWPLGLCHGWLGVLFYAWVLARDPWREIVGG
jgi:membrane protease YdiL (CAAX protease family)